jgi:hypothetical protein
MGIGDLKLPYYRAAGQTLIPGVNDLAVCSCDAQPFELCVSHNAWLMKVKLYKNVKKKIVLYL